MACERVKKFLEENGLENPGRIILNENDPDLTAKLREAGELSRYIQNEVCAGRCALCQKSPNFSPAIRHHYIIPRRNEKR